MTIRLTETEYAAHIAAKSTGKKAKKPKKSKKVGEMTKTEMRFEREILWSMRRDGDADRWEYESITLKLAPDLRYTPDFAVWSGGFLRFYEVKGGYIKDQKGRVKFLLARKLFPEHQFECWQYKDRRWTEIWRG